MSRLDVDKTDVNQAHLILDLFLMDSEEISQALSLVTEDTFNSISDQAPDLIGTDYVKVKAKAHLSHIAADRLKKIIEKYRNTFKTELEGARVA